jgi:RNA polymerase sigma-70 factor (ECF subfamily)
MSKDVSERVSLELTLLAALDSVHADVDTSEIAEIRDWSRAVRGKFHGASAKEPSRLSKLKTGLLSALRHPRVANVHGSSSGGIRGNALNASGNVASHGSVQYSQLTIPELIAVCLSESRDEAWSEFVRRFQPLITGVITKVALRFGKVSNALVEELSQEVYLRLWSNQGYALMSVEGYHEHAFFGLAKVIAANTTQDYFRRRLSSKRGPGNTPADHVFKEHESSRGSFSDLERNVLFAEIDRILKTRKHEPNFERDYAIFWLYYRNGLTAKAIAALPDIKLTVKGVESTLFRLTGQIRSALTQRTKKPK